MSTVDPFRDEAFASTCERVRALRTQLDADRDATSSLLYDVIGGETDDDQRHALIQLRRDLYNLREIDTDAARTRVARTEPRMDASDRQHVLGVIDRLGEYHRLRSRLDDACDAVLHRSRVHLVEQVQDEDVQRGIALSSPILFRQQDAYFEAAREAGFRPNSKQRKVEQSLLRYLTRTATKATPFGTFCGVTTGSWTPDDADAKDVVLRGEPSQKTAFPRLNKSLLGVLQEYIRQTPDLRRFLWVTPNPTLREEDGKFVFLDVSENGDHIRRIPSNPLLRLICDLLDEPRRIHALCDALGDTPSVDADGDAAWGFVKKLVDNGFLIETTRIGAQDLQWPEKLQQFLDDADADAAAPARDMLRAVREDADAIDAPSVDVFVERLTRMHDAVRSFVVDTGHDFTVDTPIFEDAASEGTVDIQTSDAWEATAETLQGFTRRMTRLSYLRCDQANMRHFYDAYYGASRESVGLISFFEDYYREHFKEQRRKENAGEHLPDGSTYRIANPFDLDFVDRIRDGNQRLNRLIRERWTTSPEAAQIDLTPGDVDDVLDDVPPHPDAHVLSASVLGELAFAPTSDPSMQIHLRNGGFRMGHGTFFSRFLFVLPDAVQEALLDRNRAMPFRFAELSDDANFNANLHPPLTTHSISYPPGMARDGLQHLDLRDLDVVPAPASPWTLHLRARSTGQRVVPLDAGFLALRKRPPLYNLLTKFSPSSAWYPDLPRSPSLDASGAPEPPPDVVRRPRVVFDDRLVLTRESWTVESDTILRPQQEESFVDSFLRLNRWRADLGIPESTYYNIRIEPGSVPEENQAEPHAPHGGGPQRQQELHRKPQYLDFQSPLLTRLFQSSLPDDAASVTTFEECWPSRDHLLTDADGTPYATELVIRVDAALDDADA